ncbi:hypothetical protein CPB85DRAFT_1446093 [Mucidula mucida]|nr:hypothetical protein CPB85DRAFT_1446093 [Mucidula mucida]
MAKDKSTKKFGKQATFKVNASVPAPHLQPSATGSFNVIRPDGTIDIARLMSDDNPNPPVLGPNAMAYCKQQMAMPPQQNPPANLKYAPYPMSAARPAHGQAPSSAPLYSYSSFMPGANLPTPQLPHPSTIPATAARSSGSLGFVVSTPPVNAPANFSARHYPRTSNAPTTTDNSRPSGSLLSIPSINAPTNPTAPQYPHTSTAQTSGQAAPTYQYPALMPPTNPSARHYPHANYPVHMPTAQTAHVQAAPSASGMYHPPPAMPTAKPAVPFNVRRSRIPTMNPYPNCAATTPEFISDKKDVASPPPAPAAVHNAPATTATRSAPPAPKPVNDKEVDAPPVKVPNKKEKVLTIPGCRWLRGVSADEYARTELASDKFVPEALDEEEEKLFDDLFNFEMIED